MIIAGHGSLRADREPDADRARPQDRGARPPSRDDRPHAAPSGCKAFYGDVERPDLLPAAGIAEARAVVLAIDDPEKVVKLTAYIHRRYPEVRIIARARDRHHVYQLYAAGTADSVREVFDSAVRAGKYALAALDYEEEEIERIAEAFFDARPAHAGGAGRALGPGGPARAQPRLYREGARAERSDRDGAAQAARGARTERPNSRGPAARRADARRSARKADISRPLVGGGAQHGTGHCASAECVRNAKDRHCTGSRCGLSGAGATQNGTFPHGPDVLVRFERLPWIRGAPLEGAPRSP